MRGNSVWVRVIVLVSLLALLAACGGGGSSSPGTIDSGSGGGSSTTAIAVDPYIVGAVFQEVDTDGNVIQVSQPSNQFGEAVFANEVQAGNTIEMVSTGLHAGTTFKGNLKRKVTAAGDRFVVSPLTTLAADKGDDFVTDLLAELGLSGVETYGDPVAAATTDNVNSIIANLAVNTALNMVGSSDDDNLKSVATQMATFLKAQDISAALAVENAQVNDAINSLAAYTDVVIVKAEEAKKDEGYDPDAGINVDTFTAGLPNFDQIVEEAAANAGTVVIAPDNTMTTPGITVAEKNAAGFDAFDSLQVSFTTDESLPVDDFLTAADAFKGAKLAIAGDLSATQQDKDTANFFGGIAELMAVLNPYSDFIDDNGLNNVADILDAFDIEKTQRSDFDALPLEECTTYTDGFHSWQECESLIVLTEDSPKSGELQQALATMLLGRLQVVVDSLTAVSPDFELTRDEPLFNETGVTVYDHSDALFLKGIAQAMRAQINLMQAYDFDTSLYNPFTTDDRSTEAFLIDNPDFGTLKDGYMARLAAAKADAITAGETLLAAIESIENETADQTNQLIAIDTNAEIELVKSDLNYLAASLKGQVSASNMLDRSYAFDFSKIFAGIDLRYQLPDFTGDVPSYFPDATLGGVIVDGEDINEDLDGDGSPDWLAEGYTQFSDSMLEGKELFGWVDGGENTFTFNIQEKSFIMNWTDYDPYETGTETGTYSIVNGALILTNSDLNSFFDTVEVTLVEKSDGSSFKVRMVAELDGQVVLDEIAWWWN